MTTTGPKCLTFWSGGHLCLEGFGHRRRHRCASDKCGDPSAAESCWGTHADAARHGGMPQGAIVDQPFRELKGRRR